ncbi:hypothetical protein [Marinobacter salicampi]|uniref:hypothetical protein n=1 Tax=Marinobacter salicampi TaxID=435907 RepID=UPI00140CAAEC|nr:hypothetical protein [Marinobacter salicampi]
MINRYSVATLIIVLLVVGGYLLNFHLIHGQQVSDSSSDWGAFGDYFGGVIGTALSFFALVLLIKSLSLQNEANADLKKQLKNSERTEAIKSFESLFFNLVESQNTLTEKFSIYHVENGTLVKLIGGDAIARIEDEIEIMRSSGATDDQVAQLVEALDEDDNIYNILRPFSVSVNVISKNLSDSRGFDVDTSKFYYSTLINFLAFSQLRLILIAVQFLDNHHSNNLISYPEFNDVLEELGLEVGRY